MYLALEPAGSGQLERGREIPLERTSSPYDVVEAFSGLAETSEEIDTDQLAESLTTLADLTRNTPEEFRGALDGVSRLSSNVAARDDADQHAAEEPRPRLDRPRRPRPGHRRLMEDADVLFRALVARREAMHDLLVSTSHALRGAHRCWCGRAAPTSSRR